jgi:DNA mismatch repair protein MutH
MIILPPKTESELIERASLLAGRTLGELASQANETVPRSLHHSKGWIGQLIEKHLGATAGQLSQPDFVHLGIELKTLPVTPQGHPCESTYICTAPIPPQDVDWHRSRVWRKMARMLWVPIESSPTLPLPNRRIGSPLLWSPSAAIEKQLQQDWEELTELMISGQFEKLSAKHGEYLQIRPKAANAKTFVQAVDHNGQSTSLVPKGFYVRTTLTKRLLQENYSMQSASK